MRRNESLPGLSVHTLWTFTLSLTILRHLGAGDVQMILGAIAVSFTDKIIDLGHDEHGRSWITHSLATAPIISLTPYLIIKSLITPILDLAPLQPPLAEPLNDVGVILSSILAGLTHLLWDSLTVQGIHVPGAGWVSLAGLSSRGLLANLAPAAASLAIIWWHIA